MSIEAAYNNWSKMYDTNQNKTRDIEAIALQEQLQNKQFNNCLEIGCGTGKNTLFLSTICKHITAVDFSENMLKKAKEKQYAGEVHFVKANILETWHFATKVYDLVTFSLVLEHIENIDAVFKKVAAVTNTNALVYIGELHPFKQYIGSKARYTKETGVEEVVDCFTHHISDFTKAAATNNFSIKQIEEYFDEKEQVLPRLLVLVLQKK